MDNSGAAPESREDSRRAARVREASGGARGQTAVASEAEAELIRSFEVIKGTIRGAAKALALLAHAHSGPFAHQLAFEAEWITAVLTATEPGWRADPRWATALTALEYFESFRAGAQQLGEALQSTAGAHP